MFNFVNVAQLVGRKLLATTLQSCLATGGARTAFPGSSDYTNARSQYNLRNKYAPAAFVFPTTVAQVQNAVSCSKQVGVGISPRGGGHSYEDYSLGKFSILSRICLHNILQRDRHVRFPKNHVR